MDYSIELKKKAKEYKVSTGTFVMADLVAIGYSQEDAYYIAYGRENSGLTDKQNDDMCQNIVNSNSFGTLVLKRQKAHSIPTNEVIFDQGDLFSKEQVAREMLASAMKLKKDDPNRVAALMKYADLMGMKKEEVKTDEEPTSYYLPLKCGICPFKDFYYRFKRGEVLEGE